MAESMPVAFEELVRIIKESPVSGWDNAWKVGVTPWDSGDVQPALCNLIMSNELDLPKNGRALIPGCGKGYDATFIASQLGLDVLAIDLSSTAIQAARDRFDTSSSRVPDAKVSFEVADFFAFSVPDDQRFTLIYDYTFFVAIPPVLRSDWGKQISALLKPGGYLITLVWPLNLPADDDGPPFFVKPEHYVDVLGDGWEKVLDKVPEISIPQHRCNNILCTGVNDHVRIPLATYMNVYDGLRHAVKLQPDIRTFCLSLQFISHRVTLPMYESRRARIQSDCTVFCKTLLDDMNSLNVPFTSAALDLAMRIRRQLLKLVYGIDLDFPDHPPVQGDHSATVDAGIPQLPNFQPFSTAALNTTVDMVGRSGNVSKLVQAFEVLTQPLPPQASQHYSLGFDRP
ncbi:S-adenosyl-L-methionine-dependent methyltransferase [Butyriboletus roseoflavus]|nr:S-adenosyl-L-methionine-dependent methyltransferase [Butyriboletus roseoflavus]